MRVFQFSFGRIKMTPIFNHLLLPTHQTNQQASKHRKSSYSFEHLPVLCRDQSQVFHSSPRKCKCLEHANQQARERKGTQIIIISQLFLSSQPQCDIGGELPFYRSKDVYSINITQLVTELGSDSKPGALSNTQTASS